MASTRESADEESPRTADIVTTCTSDPVRDSVVEELVHSVEQSSDNVRQRLEGLRRRRGQQQEETIFYPSYNLSDKDESNDDDEETMFVTGKTLRLFLTEYKAQIREEFTNEINNLKGELQGYKRLDDSKKNIVQDRPADSTRTLLQNGDGSLSQTGIQNDHRVSILVQQQGQAQSSQSLQQTENQQPQQQLTPQPPSQRPTTRFWNGLRGMRNTVVLGQDYWWLEQDTFTMMFTSDNLFSPSFIYAIVVMALQITILHLIVEHILRDVQTFDPDLEQYGPIAQGIAMLVAVASQDDMRVSVVLFLNGYREEDLISDFPGATKPKWIISNLCRYLEGTMTLIASVLLIDSADDVLDIFERFVAVGFVAQLDNLAFTLARSGYVTTSIMEEARCIEKAKVPRRTKTALLLWILFGFPLIPVSLYLSLLGQRSNFELRRMDDFCRIVQVQFPRLRYNLPSTYQLDLEPVTNPANNASSTLMNAKDKEKQLDRNTTTNDEGLYRLAGSRRVVPSFFSSSNPPDLDYALFSGYYHILMKSPEKVVRVNERPVYYENGVKDASSGMFFYCSEEQAWAFTIPILKDAMTGYCQLSRIDVDMVEYESLGWLWLSPVSFADRLDHVPISSWTARTGTNGQVSSSSTDLAITCMECNLEGVDYTCQNGHSCIRDTRGIPRTYCDCQHPYHGPSCQAASSCVQMQLIIEGYCPLTMNSVSGLLVQDRPVYLSSQFADLSLVYLGRRWYLSRVSSPIQSLVVRGDELTMSSSSDSWNRHKNWWEEDGSVHGYWTGFTHPNYVVAQSSFTATYDPTVSNRLAWSSGDYLKRSPGSDGARNGTLDLVSLQCLGVRNNKNCSKGTSTNGRCACPNGTFGNFCEFRMGECTKLFP